MPHTPSLDDLWQSARPQGELFQIDARPDLPATARCYLNHAIAPGTPLATAVRLHMHGEIKLKAWRPFQAEQVICWPRGMIWQASTRINGLPVRGADTVVDGAGVMSWKILGLWPVKTESGPDVTRSALGRCQAESIWLPSVLADPAVTWSSLAENQAQATVTLGGETTDLILSLDDRGRPTSMGLKRWGNPDGGEHRYVDFGAYLEQEGTFSGYTIPTQLRVGWYFGTDRFESEGEFFRATVDRVMYR